MTIKKILLEYLTDEQRKEYSKHTMSDHARAATDHFFGVGNDVVHGEVSAHPSETEHNKSEIHKKVENHLGRELSHEEYATGYTKDHLGRTAKLGGMIKDQNLRNEFASDTSREGAKTHFKAFKTSTHRGVEVAGQTNSSPNAIHPNGHSWGQLSCKNTTSGVAKDYLPNEIKHGTVVHFVHDDSGKEIYRATLQPHHRGEHTAYNVESEHGVKNPRFTESARAVASKLSVGPSGIYTKHDDVYDDTGSHRMLHIDNSNVDHEIRRHILSSGYDDVKAVVNHPAFNSEHVEYALTHSDSDDTKARVLEHKSCTTSQAKRVLNDRNENDFVKAAAVRHKGLTPRNLHSILDAPSIGSFAKANIFRNPNANNTHVSQALWHNDEHIQRAAYGHESATDVQISNGLNHESKSVRKSAAMNPSLKAHHAEKLLDGDDHELTAIAMNGKHITPEIIHRALDHHSTDVRQNAISNKNASEANIMKALGDHSRFVAAKAAAHKNSTENTLKTAIAHSSDSVVSSAVYSPAFTVSHAKELLNHPSPRVKAAAERFIRNSPHK